MKDDLGYYKDRKYLIYVDADDWNDPENTKFVVTAYYRKIDMRTGEEQKIEICRIDNKSHGFTHMDQLFKTGEPKKKMDVGFYEAWQIIKDNWKKYARRHDKNHTT